jgi:hypothetical protein
MFINENLPNPISQKKDISDVFYFSLFRESVDPVESKLISLPVSGSTYAFLPPIIPQGIYSTEYIIKPSNNIIQSINTTDYLITDKIMCKYDISINANSDINGVIILQLVDGSDNVYDDGKLEMFGDIYTTSKTYKLTGVIYHDKNDIVKLRVGGYKVGDTNATINISISQINIFVST